MSGMGILKSKNNQLLRVMVICIEYAVFFAESFSVSPRVFKIGHMNCDKDEGNYFVIFYS